ncbi:MAG: rane fusion protein multidrug efflux system [Burkholderiales bacterium]
MPLMMMCALFACGKNTGTPPQPPPPEVTVMKVSTMPVTVYDDYAAQTEAVQSVEIRARVGGILQRQAFKDGTTVKKDELLFLIDQEPFRSALAQARAALAQAQASWMNSRQNLARVPPLLSVQAISQQEADAIVARERADAASVEAGKAQVRQAELNLGYTSIRAPRDGMISRALIKPGGLVNASTTLMATLYSVDPIYVGFTISEEKLAELQSKYNLQDRKLMKTPDIKLRLIDGSDYQYSGKFDFLDPAVDPRNGTLPVRLVVPNPEGMLRHGQFVRAIVPARENPNSIVVPQKAVQELQGKHSVFVVGPDNKAIYRDVDVGPRVGNDWVVERGLKAGELLIVEGISKVKPGMVVKPVPAGQKQAAPTGSPAQPAKAGG